MAPFRKSITAAVTGLIGWATTVVTSAPSAITASEWIGLATVMAVAVGVFGVPNKEQ